MPFTQYAILLISGFPEAVPLISALLTCPRQTCDDFRGSFQKPAFKVNHYALFIKLMKRHIPDQLLVTIENLFSGCCTCIKLGNFWSTEFEIGFRVRQGSVLSPFLFAIYTDDLAALCKPNLICMLYYMLMAFFC